MQRPQQRAQALCQPHVVALCPQPSLHVCSPATHFLLGCCVLLHAVVTQQQGGRSRLPDVFIADKNDTAKFDGSTAGKFALMALAVRRGEGGQLVAIDHVTPAVSNPFVVSMVGCWVGVCIGVCVWGESDKVWWMTS